VYYLKRSRDVFVFREYPLALSNLSRFESLYPRKDAGIFLPGYFDSLMNS